MRNTTVAPYNDYVQSANALFHFVNRPDYLKSILKDRALKPRYCEEDVGYLNLQVENSTFRKIAVLQKCFCDIPFHKLMGTFKPQLVDDNSLDDKEKQEFAGKNTHPDYYGKYAIALSKKWGEDHNLLPIHYITDNSFVSENFSKVFSNLINVENLSDDYAECVFNRLAFMKPLRGTMSRSFEFSTGRTLSVELYKNFHDEREWRYVPDPKAVHALGSETIIANPRILANLNSINKALSDEKYESIWLKYDYNEIRYILVPDSTARLDIIETILNIPSNKFKNSDGPEQIQRAKHILISKILVLDEIGRDW